MPPRKKTCAPPSLGHSPLHSTRSLRNPRSIYDLCHETKEPDHIVDVTMPPRSQFTATAKFYNETQDSSCQSDQLHSSHLSKINDGVVNVKSQPSTLIDINISQSKADKISTTNSIQTTNLNNTNPSNPALDETGSLSKPYKKKCPSPWIDLDHEEEVIVVEENDDLSFQDGDVMIQDDWKKKDNIVNNPSEDQYLHPPSHGDLNMPRSSVSLLKVQNQPIGTDGHLQDLDHVDSLSSDEDFEVNHFNELGRDELEDDQDAVVKQEVADIEEEMFTYLDYSSQLKLKPDHQHRSLWVCPDRRIFLETFSQRYIQEYDFLIAIAHPVARTQHMHQYLLNHGSLYGAVSVGLDTKEILQKLDDLSKVYLPPEVTAFIEMCTTRFGKIKLLLYRNKYFIQGGDRELLTELRADPEISSCALSPIVEQQSDLGNDENVIGDGKIGEMMEDDDELARILRKCDYARSSQDHPGNGVILSNSACPPPHLISSHLPSPALFNAWPHQDDLSRSSMKPISLYSFEIDSKRFETVKRRCIELEYPLVEEYDFGHDTDNISINISLKPTTHLRLYQQKCLAKMFAHGRVKSGIISLACGAGKSLVGVTACSTIKKRTLLLCTSTVSVQQWMYQFLLWSNISRHSVVGFTSGCKNRISCEADLGSVLLTTYCMLSHGSRRSGYSSFVIDLIEKQEWGLVILDEVHIVPANTFRSVISKVKSHCKLGLSATLVREDELIHHLLYLIGPKLYEANWLDLSTDGHIANVCCAEVWCPMTPEFFKEYIVAEPRRARALYMMNPNKMRTCQYLIQFHEARNDKILVFSDDILVLRTYAHAMNKPFIYGSTPNAQRMQLLSSFQYNINAKTLFISKVGDNSIDLPEATVLIQISSHYGSRRQEAQRLGRILRPKTRKMGIRAFDAFFYSLVSQDTKEMYYAAKRQQFLIEQGYAFKVCKDIHRDPSISVMETRESQMTLLRKVLAADVESLHEMDEKEDERETMWLINQLPDKKEVRQGKRQPFHEAEETEYTYTRLESNALVLTGAMNITYDEMQLE